MGVRYARKPHCDNTIPIEWEPCDGEIVSKDYHGICVGRVVISGKIKRVLRKDVGIRTFFFGYPDCCGRRMSLHG